MSVKLRSFELIEKELLARSEYFSGEHDEYHAFRVRDTGLYIRQKEGGDHRIVEPACLLHDYFWPNEKRNKEFLHYGSQALKGIEEILRRCNVEEMFIKKILYCIEMRENYSFSINSEKPISKEALILQDADRLDAIGAIGIARCFYFAGAHNQKIYLPDRKRSEKYDPKDWSNTPIEHIHEKLLKLKDELHFETSRKIAEERHNFLKQFIEQFYKEIRVV